jgi:hypothetical protein
MSHIFRLLKEKCDGKRYMYLNVNFILIILVFRSPHRLTVHSINSECRIQYNLAGMLYCAYLFDLAKSCQNSQQALS